MKKNVHERKCLRKKMFAKENVREFAKENVCMNFASVGAFANIFLYYFLLITKNFK